MRRKGAWPILAIMTLAAMALLSILSVLEAPSVSAQEPSVPPNLWASLRFFVGTWEGHGETFVFVSEAIENIPAGFRARLTYRPLDADTFEQTFNLAPPGQDFTCNSKGVMKRMKGAQK